jgi:hypothetical protein
MRVGCGFGILIIRTHKQNFEIIFISFGLVCCRLHRLCLVVDRSSKMASGGSGGARKDLRRELSILERSFPRHGEHCFRVILASPEELVCRFVHNNRTYNLQCSISVSLLSFLIVASMSE